MTRLLAAPLVLAAAVAHAGSPAPVPAACTLRLSTESPHIPGVTFDELARQAVTAEDAGRVEDAVRLYRAAVDANPRWHDGWWSLAVLLSNAGCDEAARTALRHVVTINTQAGPGWALLGVSDFRLGSFDTAFTYLSRGIGLGLAAAPEVGRRSLHALTLLLIRRGDFAATARNLGVLARLEPDDPELRLACGLAALRLPRLPSELDAGQREVADAAGRAALALLGGRGAEGHEAFEALIARYPFARGVNLAYGLVLSREASSRALPMLQKEVAQFPDSAEAQTALAFEQLERGTPAEAVAPARAAARLSPESCWSHLALGRALLATGEVDEAVRQLEEAERQGPGVREVYVALAQAYGRGGRTADVERARQRLQQIDAATGAGR